MRLAIDKLSHDGRGIAHSDGKICFVAGALPNEVVQARRIATRARHDDFETVAVVSASPQRVAPPCQHYGACGGCDLQHLDPKAQLSHKQNVVLEVLARAARMTPSVLEAPIASSPFRYRTRARLAIDTRSRGKPVVGFREEARSAIVPIAHCHVLDDRLAELPRELSALFAELEGPRAIGHVDVALSESPSESFPVVGLRVTGAIGERDRARLAEFAARRRAYLALEDSNGGVTYLHRPSADAPGYRLPAFDLRIEFAPGDFVQGNADVNRALVERVVDWAAVDDGAEALDAFCGLGNFALPLARRGARVLGIEVDRRMVERARANAEANGVETAEFVVRDLQADEFALPRTRFDVAVLDPPRTGARASVARLAAERVPTLVYASCMASALGRDARVLADAGYALERLCVVDMFPETSHIEALARFVRTAGKRKR